MASLLQRIAFRSTGRMSTVRMEERWRPSWSHRDEKSIPLSAAEARLVYTSDLTAEKGRDGHTHVHVHTLCMACMQAHIRFGPNKFNSCLQYEFYRALHALREVFTSSLKVSGLGSVKSDRYIVRLA